MDASDAIALERPSPERDIIGIVVQLPAPQQDDPSEVNWIPGHRVSLGRITVSVSDSPQEELVGNEAGVAIGTIGTEVVAGGANAFFSGVQAGVSIGSLVVNAQGSNETILAGVSTGVSVGSITVEAGAEVTLSGIEAGVSVGDINATAPWWEPSTFDLQFNGSSLRTWVQKQ